MVRATRRGRIPTPPPPPTCAHCGTVGHIADLCPRTAYTAACPAITCRQCVHIVESATTADGIFDITHRIRTAT